MGTELTFNNYLINFINVKKILEDFTGSLSIEVFSLLIFCDNSKSDQTSSFPRSISISFNLLSFSGTLKLTIIRFLASLFVELIYSELKLVKHIGEYVKLDEIFLK